MRTIVISQPFFFPWVGMLEQMRLAGVYVHYDDVQFSKGSFTNRVQIKTAQGAHWLTVPVRQQLGQKILDVKIDNSTEWRRKHWQTLQQCYRKAPAFAMYAQELDQFYSREWIGLNELNIELLAMLMRWMDIRTPMLRSSQMKATGAASELVLNLCLETGATRYLSGTGGQNYLEPEAFESAGVEIVYCPSVLPENYPQLYPQAGFINHLSALDLLLNCGEAWRNYLPAEVATT